MSGHHGGNSGSSSTRSSGSRPQTLPSSSSTTSRKITKPSWADVFPFSRKWHVIKIALVTTSFLVGFALFTLAVTLAVRGKTWPPPILWVAPLVVISGVWDAAELLIICVRRSHLGISPGAHVAVDLVISVAAAVSLLLTAFVYRMWKQMVDFCKGIHPRAVFYGPDSHRKGSYGDFHGGGFGSDFHHPPGHFKFGPCGQSDDDESNRALQTFPILIATIGLLGLLLVIHVVLFCRAVVEIKRRKRSRHATAANLPARPSAHGMPPGSIPLTRLGTGSSRSQAHPSAQVPHESTSQQENERSASRISPTGRHSQDNVGVAVCRPGD